MALRLPTRLVWFVVLLGFLTSSCQSTSISPGQPSAISLLVHLDAPAQIKREGWKDYQPIGFGTLVYNTDLLKTAGSVTLLCPDLQTIKTLSGEGRNPCPLPNAGFTLRYDDMLFSPGVRGVTTTTIPTLISPRNTAILDPHPLLRWKDTGAVTYTAEVRQGSQLVWSTKDITGTEISYPADAPTLEAGKDYLLVVTDNTTGHSSTEDKEKGLGFQVADQAERAETESRRESILSLAGLDAPSQNLALAMYDLNQRTGGRGLWGDARLLLEKVVQTRPNEPAVWLYLGDVLAKMKLWEDANAAYQKALALAETSGDLETQADALAAMWRIDPSAQSQFDQAFGIYKTIGSNDKLENLKEAQTP